MIVLTGPFKLICLALPQGEWWEGSWRLERVTEPAGLIVEGKCEFAERSEFAAKGSALRAGMQLLEQHIKTDREAHEWRGGPAAAA